jgi:hypothetical protein
MAEATWYPFGDAGGFYVLTASTTGTTNNRMWFITMIQRGDNLFIAGAPSDIAAQCVAVGQFSGKWRAFIGVTDRLREILDFTLQGAGWSATQQIYCEFIMGNHQGNFTAFHHIRYDGTNAKDLTVQTKKLDNSDSRTHNPLVQDGSFFASIHREGTRFKLRFNFPTDDTAKREIKNMRPALKAKARLI